MASTPASEAQLLEGCRAGDPHAAKALVHLYEQPLLRTVARLVWRRSIAEEIVQETFLRMFERIDRIDPRQGVDRWLFGVAINLARDHLKKSSSQEVLGTSDDEALPLYAPEEGDVEQEAAAAEKRQTLERVLRRLSPRLREVVLLHYMEDRPLSEVAAILGTTHTTARMRAMRARMRIRALLRETHP